MGRIEKTSFREFRNSSARSLRRAMSFVLAALSTTACGNGAEDEEFLTVEEFLRTPPQITSAPPAVSNSSVATFTFRLSGATSYRCQLDALAYETCASGKTYASLSQGPHVFHVRGIDWKGRESADAQYDWRVDTTTPVVTFLQTPPNPSTSEGATFSFSANEPSQFQCALDGAEETSCTTPFSLTGLSPGAHTLDVLATDPAGNVGVGSYAWTRGEMIGSHQRVSTRIAAPASASSEVPSAMSATSAWSRARSTPAGSHEGAHDARSSSTSLFARTA